MQTAFSLDLNENIIDNVDNVVKYFFFVVFGLEMGFHHSVLGIRTA